MSAWIELVRQEGAINQSLDIAMRTTSGTPQTGLTSASAGLAFAYRRGPTGVVQTLTPVAQTVTGAHVDNGFCELQSTNMPGAYRLDLPDAVFAGGVREVTVVVQATGCLPVYIRISLVEYDTYLDGPTVEEFAASVLKVDWTGITGEAARSMLNAFRPLRNKWSISGDVLTVYKEDDVTVAYTATLTSAAGAEGITSADPT